MLKEHDRVVLKSAVPNERLVAGDVGNVVHVYPDGLAYEVEFTSWLGDTPTVATLEATQVRRRTGATYRTPENFERLDSPLPLRNKG
jgi:Domain of unknown function (DUF4926)